MKSWEQESSLHVFALAQVPHIGTLEVFGGKQAHNILKLVFPYKNKNSTLPNKTIKNNRLFTFLIHSSTWSFHLRLSENVTPRIFADDTTGSLLPRLQEGRNRECSSLLVTNQRPLIQPSVCFQLPHVVGFLLRSCRPCTSNSENPSCLACLELGALRYPGWDWPPLKQTVRRKSIAQSATHPDIFSPRIIWTNRLWSIKSNASR